MARVVSACVQVGRIFNLQVAIVNLNVSGRSTMMLWFLWELRITMKYEHSTQKLDFLLHFGASSLVWFIYLPIVAIIAVNVNPLWRYKLLLGRWEIELNSFDE